MRRPQGYAQIFGPALDGPHSDPGVASLHKNGECDTFTCGHCQRIVLVPARQAPTTVGGLCRICNGLVCVDCAKQQRCQRHEEAIERALMRESRRRALLGVQ